MFSKGRLVVRGISSSHRLTSMTGGLSADTANWFLEIAILQRPSDRISFASASAHAVFPHAQHSNEDLPLSDSGRLRNLIFGATRSARIQIGFSSVLPAGTKGRKALNSKDTRTYRNALSSGVNADGLKMTAASHWVCTRRGLRAFGSIEFLIGRDAEIDSREPNGGETGIRTLGAREGTTVFETAPFDRSGTSPCLASDNICMRDNQ